MVLFHLENLSIEQDASDYDKLVILYEKNPEIISAISTSINAARKYLVDNKSNFRDIGKFHSAVMGAGGKSNEDGSFAEISQLNKDIFAEICRERLEYELFEPEFKEFSKKSEELSMRKAALKKHQVSIMIHKEAFTMAKEVMNYHKLTPNSLAAQIVADMQTKPAQTKPAQTKPAQTKPAAKVVGGGLRTVMRVSVVGCTIL